MMYTNHEQGQAANCMDFVRSMRHRFLELANSPEVVTKSDQREKLDELTAEMHQLNKNGTKLVELAEMYGVHHTTIRQRLLRRGYEIYNHGSGKQKAKK